MTSISSQYLGITTFGRYFKHLPDQKERDLEKGIVFCCHLIPSLKAVSCVYTPKVQAELTLKTFILQTNSQVWEA